MIISIYIENNRIDLFESDGINIVQGVQDVNDISKIRTDFSKTFRVPASDNNNRIFKHYYNANINNTFDARTKKEGFILINGVPFKFGSFRLENVKKQKGKAVSYGITFFSDAINIKDKIGSDELKDLPFLSNFNHSYQSVNILQAFTNGLNFTVGNKFYEKAIIYPLISYTKQYFYNSDPQDLTDEEKLVNIAYDENRTNGVNIKDLKPCIKASVIIDAIKEKYDIPFDGTFFNSGSANSIYFEDLYINLNKETESLNDGTLTFENVTDVLPPSTLLRFLYSYRVSITPKIGYENTPYKLIFEINGTKYEETTFISGDRIRFVNRGITNGNYTIKASVVASGEFEFNAETNIFEVDIQNTTFVNVYNQTYLNQQINFEVDLLSILPELKVFDFLTSIFKMFNLTIEVFEKRIQYEDLQYWYSTGNIYDITKYIDQDTEDVSRGKIFNEVQFLFQESDQILADKYNSSNKRYYGSLDQRFYEDEEQTKPLDGQSLSIEVEFENPIFERLINQNGGLLTNIQYCPYIDKGLEPISGGVFLLYLNQVDISQNPIGFKDRQIYQQVNACYMPSHTVNINDVESFSINFNAELSEYTYQPMTNNIYSRFYSDYLGDIFSIKRRNFKFKGELPESLLQKIRMNDRLIIKNNRYLINSISSNLINRKDDFDLINDVYSAPLASDILNNSVFFPSSKNYGFEEITDSAQYIGVENQTPILIDSGFGTDFITINTFTSNSVMVINYTIQRNEGFARTVQIQVLDGINNPILNIVQSGEGKVKFDNNNITWDNNNITWDNG